MTLHSITVATGLLLASSALAQVTTTPRAPTYDDIKPRLEPYQPEMHDEEVVGHDAERDDPDSDSESARNSGSDSEPTRQPAPGLLYVDRLATTRALDRSLLMLDALLLSPGHAEMSLGLSSARNQQSYPELLQDEAGDSLSAGVSEWQTETSTIRIELQAGLPLHSELELSIPFNSVRASTTLSNFGEIIDESEETSSGFGDIRMTFLKAMVEESGFRPDINLFASVDADSAETERPATGTGTTETTFGLNATKRQDPLVFTAGLAHTLATRSGDLKTGARTRVTVGTVLAASSRTSLHFQYSQYHTDGATLDGRELVSGRDRSAVLTIGATSLVSRKLLVSGTVSTALTTRDTDYSFNLLVSRRFELFRR